MPGDPSMVVTMWRNALPVLAGRTVTLREPAFQDLPAIVELLATVDATHFGLDEPISELGLQDFIARAAGDRAAGLAFTYVITLTATHSVVGLAQVRQLDPAFEAAEWEFTLAPSVRGTTTFLEA